MIAQDYRQLIIEGINDLPPDILAEITDYVYFVRKRAVRPRDFQDELMRTLLDTELNTFERQEMAHLEEEFHGYEERYPIE